MSTSIKRNGQETLGFVHPKIGFIKGTTHEPEVVQFLGLQYATLSDRFAPPVMKVYDKSAITHATELGPQILSIPNGPQNEQRLIQHSLPDDVSKLTASDIEGLNLNITVPLAEGEHGLPHYRKLPVFCFIHGGGFVLGSATWPQYNFARFVRLSIHNGTPCIALAFNYRLQHPGLLYCKELRDAGYKPNNSIRDQRTALQWVKTYISGFGGDPEQVTLAGESAGGSSCTYHLFAEEALSVSPNTECSIRHNRYNS